jgi:hypothetical protein
MDWTHKMKPHMHNSNEDKSHLHQADLLRNEEYRKEQQDHGINTAQDWKKHEQSVEFQNNKQQRSLDQ